MKLRSPRPPTTRITRHVRRRLYLETSVWGTANPPDFPRPPVKEPTLEKAEITNRFLAVANRIPFEMCISAVVTEEISDTREPELRRWLIGMLERFQPLILPIEPEAYELAEIYIRQGTLPRKAENDALHLAVATVHGLDAVISWNMKHMVKWKTREEVTSANLFNGYRSLAIMTPEEVI